MEQSVVRSAAPAWSSDGSTPALLVRAEKHDVAYAPTWDWGGEYLCEEHERVFDVTGELEGLGYREDSLKLYELAWFSPGDVLEIGTFHGRATATMALALERSKNPSRVVSIDVDPAALSRAGSALRSVGLGGRVTLARGTAKTVLRRMPGFRPGLVFVDGDHSYRGVTGDLAELEPVVPAGAIVAMHDYEGYEDEDPYLVRVSEAVADSWLASDGEYLGRFGLCGTFVRRSGGPPALDPRAQRPPFVLNLDRTVVRTAADRFARKVDHRAFHLSRRLGRRA